MQSNNDNSGRSSVQPACAACKHQRKKCIEGCKLAVYFPADKSREFQAVHKVFGVSNVIKIVYGVDEEDRTKVVDSLIWEALWRQKNPVLGPYGEYKRLCEELKSYKSQALMQSRHQSHQLVGGLPGQGGMIFQPPLIGWHEANNVLSMEEAMYNNNAGNYICRDKADSMVQFVQNPTKIKQERDVGGVVNIPVEQQEPQRLQQSMNFVSQHEHSITRGFNQQYYISGSFC
ncbi:LOB domain-containing protein 2-like [Mangifera indica]|uniref:LOB domain-containing protein 2-like n=1 Tax=Mangifera indica TaxID=29780 RepID=UPI001CFB2C0C|nr:LOB domain-containing protein 2-like [Mangifera indica]